MGINGLPSEYGYVILTGIGSVFMTKWMAMRCGKARKEHGVKYPVMYSDENNGQNIYNCVQRAHQNTLENYPEFLFFLMAGGVAHPCLSSAAGLVWIAGKVVYALGYYTGKPEKRVKGAFSYIGLLTLLGTSISTAYQLLH